MANLQPADGATEVAVTSAVTVRFDDTVLSVDAQALLEVAAALCSQPPPCPVSGLPGSLPILLPPAVLSQLRKDGSAVAGVAAYPPSLLPAQSSI